MAYRLTRRARRDALEIWKYIARDSESAADRFIDRLTHHFRILGEAPHAGRTRDELRPGYRSFPVGEYLIFYRVRVPGVEIMHIVHGRRDLTRYHSELPAIYLPFALPFTAYRCSTCRPLLSILLKLRLTMDSNPT